MKIMLDTNILILALIFGGKARKVMLELLQEEHEIYVSEYVANEFLEKIQMKWPQKADKVMDAFRDLPVHFCKSSAKMQGSLRDLKDIPVLSGALYHNVDVILTGDKDFWSPIWKSQLCFP